MAVAADPRAKDQLLQANDRQPQQEYEGLWQPNHLQIMQEHLPTLP